MNKLVMILSIVIVLLSSCVSQKVATYDNSDDIYANPAEDRKEEARLAIINKQQQDLADKRYSDSLAKIKMAQKIKDDANPAYKDREFKYDDYYDYEYATRVKRFNNNINGLSYYDNYYTNSYWYNNNPYNYGVSVYNGYSWWGNSYNNYSYNPQSNFYNSFGWNSCPNYGYNGFNPYNSYNPYGYGYYNGYNNGYINGYNNGYFNGFNNYGYGGYNPYAPYYGYGNGYNYNNWGYYNSYDNNSQYTYGPRSSHGGGNSRRTSNAGMSTNAEHDSYYNRFANTIVAHQNQAVKFEPLPKIVVTNEINPVRTNTKGNIIENINHIKSNVAIDRDGNVSNHSNQPIRSNVSTNSNSQIVELNNNGNTSTNNSNQPIRNNTTKADVYTTPTNSNIQLIENGTNNGGRNHNSYQQQNTSTTKEQPVLNSETKPVRNQYENKPIEVKPAYQEPPRNNYQELNNYQVPSNNNGGSQPKNSDGGSSSGGRPR